MAQNIVTDIAGLLGDRRYFHQAFCLLRVRLWLFLPKEYHPYGWLFALQFVRRNK
jgi:hypothetical protein